ncbi:MAG: cytochrome c oxidase subunit II [Proteobacteria bacterium]|nr:cytochrome c oxidase subunit II [Pseudomonadota bacterium]
MARGSFVKGPNYVHPEKGSAVGSRNSLYRDGRNEYLEAKVVIDEEVDKILNHVSSKLPPEILEKMHVGATVKELLHNYFNQGLHNMYNRYLVTVEDEMGKRFRDLVDKQEAENLNIYTPKEVGELLDTIGGEDNFHNGAVEKSVVNVYANLQNHLQKGIFSLESKTKKILSEKNDIGAILDGQYTNSVLRCNFRDNPMKPETVTDVNLVLNIVESELLEPIYHYQIASEVIIKNVLSEHILKLVEREVEKLNQELIDHKQKELNKNSIVFEKIKKLEEFVGFEETSEDSPQFSHMAKKFLDAIKGIEAEIGLVDYDPLNIRENVQLIIDDENIRNRGYNVAVNALITILDNSHLGYQHIENFKNCRKTVIREYANMNPIDVPDEHYGIDLVYLDDLQLREHRAAFAQQMSEFETETDKLVSVFETMFQNEKRKQGFIEYEDVARQILPKKRKKFLDAAEQTKKLELWDDISFIRPEKSEIEKLNDTFALQKRILARRFKTLRERVSDLYQYDYPPERIIVEQRLDFLEEEYDKFNQTYNPFQAHPGLFMELTVSSIKRRETTVSAMSRVLTQFITKVSTGFYDAAFDEFHETKAAEQLGSQEAF